MLQQPYISGFERRTFEVFGITLHPLTLGHVQILAEMECSIAFPGKKIKAHDIGTLAFVCSYPMWEDARDASRKQDLIDKVLTKISTFTKDDIKAGIESAVDYLVYYKSVPETDKGSANWDLMRVPWWWGYAEFMQSVMGRSETDAWATICSDAFAYWACFLTRNGDESVLINGDADINIRLRQGMDIREQFDRGLL